METQTKSSLDEQLETPAYLSFTEDFLEPVSYHKLYQ